MQLAIAIIAAVSSLAGLVYKAWRHKKDVARLEVEVAQLKDQTKKLATLLGDTTGKLISKERTLRNVEAKLAAKLSVPELVDELNELRLRRKPAGGSTSGDTED